MADPGRLLDVTRLRLGRSLQSKLAALFSIVFAAIAVMLNVYLPQKFERQATEALDARGLATANLAAYAVQPGLLAEDDDQLEEALGAIMQSSAVEYVAASDMRGRLLATAGALDAEFEGRVTAEGLVREGAARAYVTIVEIPSERGPVGRITLALSAAPFEAAGREGRWTAAVVSIGILAFGLLAVAVISVNVTRPLVAMVGTAERIASGDLAHRAADAGDDEVGQLAAAFNRMVDRVQAGQKAVRVRNAQFRRILDHLPVEVALLDPDGRYVYVNPAGPGTGVESRDIIGSTAEELWASREVDALCDVSPAEAVKRCVEKREAVQTTVRLTLPDGTERHVIRGYSPIFATSGAAQQVIAFGLDVTDRIAAESALRESEAKLMQAAKMESIGRLAGGVAHDFNNLLTAILGHCEILLMDMEEGDPNRDSAEEITRASNRAAELTKRLLMFSRKQATNPVPLNLNDIVTDMERMLERLIGHEVSLRFTPDREIGLILSDATQVEQVVLNLAVNARDAMPDGGTLLIETREVEVDDEVVGATGKLERGSYIQLSVSDTGVGMDEDTMSRIFDPFFTSKGPNEGTGLGLATVYGILKAGGGTITVHSDVGQGTTFRVFFPRAEIGVAEDEAEAPEVADDAGEHGGDENILIVEDQESVLSAAKNILERSGYRVRCTTNPTDALEFARRSKDPIHLLLTDVMMPEMTGPELADAIGFVSPDTLVLYMSGYTGDALQHRGVLESEVRLVEKPFVAADLCRAVREALDSAPPGAEYDWSDGPERLVGPRPAE
ncbi:MAG: ATP-binding protein [Gemmatimonadota bacterium]|nr:ATP-binding protein [Gemmatimonadota bacterium]